MHELTNIAKDNPDVFIEIMRYLAPQELAQVSLVNHDFHELTQDEVLWKLKFKQHFPADFPTSVPNDFNWKKAFIKQYRNALCTSDYLKEKIPEEVLFKILSYLTPKTILTEVNPLSPFLANFSHDSLLWQQLFIEHFPEELPLRPSENYDWLNAFKEKYRAKYKNVKITTITSIIRDDVETINAAKLRVDELEANNFLLVKTALKNKSQDCLDHFFKLVVEEKSQSTSKMTLLHWMVLCNQIDKVEAYDNNNELNAQNNKGQTALMLAIENGLFSIFQHLIAKEKINRILMDTQKKTFFIYILKQDNSDMLRLTFNNLAQRAQNYKQRNSKQPIDAPKQKRDTNNLLTQYATQLLMPAIQIGASNCFQFLLRPEISPSTDLLERTIQFGRLSMLSTLLKNAFTLLKSSDARIKALNGYIVHAAHYGHYEIYKYLSNLLCERMSSDDENQDSVVKTEELTLIETQATTSRSNPSLPLSLRCELFEAAAKNGHFAFIQSLLEEKIIDFSIKEELLAAKAISQASFGLAFFHALSKNNINIIKFFLAKEFININQELHAQEGTHPNLYQLTTTALHIATRYNYIELMEFLLDKGSNIDTRDNKNRTALYMAVTSKSSKGLELLLNRGANPAIGASLLHQAIKLNFPEGLAKLLKAAPEGLAHIKTSKQYYRPLVEEAIVSDSESCVEILLDHGDKIKLGDFKKAIENERLKIVHMFLEKTTKFINSAEEPLLLLCQYNKPMLQLLLQYGANPLTCIENCIAQKKSVSVVRDLLELNNKLKLPKIDIARLFKQARMVKNKHMINYLKKELAFENDAKENGVSTEVQLLKEEAQKIGYRNGQYMAAKKSELEEITLAPTIKKSPVYIKLSKQQKALIHKIYEQAYRQGHAHGLAKRQKPLEHSGRESTNSSDDEKPAKKRKITSGSLFTKKRKKPDEDTEEEPIKEKESTEENDKPKKCRKLTETPVQTEAQQLAEALTEDKAEETEMLRSQASTSSTGTNPNSFFATAINNDPENRDIENKQEQKPQSPKPM